MGWGHKKGGYDWRQHVRGTDDPKIQNRIREKIEAFLRDEAQASLLIPNDVSKPERNTYKHFARTYKLHMNKLGRGQFELRKVDRTADPIEELHLMTLGLLGKDWVRTRDVLWQARQSSELWGQLCAVGVTNCSQRKLQAHEEQMRKFFEISHDWMWVRPLEGDGKLAEFGRQVWLTDEIKRKIHEVTRLAQEAMKGLEPQHGRQDIKAGSGNWGREPLRGPTEKSPGFATNLPLRKRLPAYQYGEKFLDEVRQNDVVVVCGATGCGKTTQLPQLCMDAFFETRILCTQPRRISATSIAARVAFERSEKMGDQVGYQIRFDAVTSPQTRLLYVTVGVLLRFLVGNPLLDGINLVILDEVHERGIQTDFTLLLLRDISDERRRAGTPLKLVLMSATIDASLFIDYFKNGHGSERKVSFLDIPGKTNYPIEEFWAEDIFPMIPWFEPSGFKPGLRMEDARNEWATPQEVQRRLNGKCRDSRVAQCLVNTLRRPLKVDPLWIKGVMEYIDAYRGEGAVLIFVPGWQEITDTIKALEQGKRTKSKVWHILPLHSMIPPQEQNKIFQPVPTGTRKIIVSTTIAETSITVDDVVYVIDTGLTKGTTYTPENNLSSLSVLRIARSNAQQRRGRAGRCRAGEWYKLYSSLDWEDMADSEVPEMIRTPVEELCLQVRALEIRGPIADTLSRALEPPTDIAIERALVSLRELGALEDNEVLTPLGWRLSMLPVNPFLGKMLLLGNLFGANQGLLSVCSTLGFKSPFVLPFGKEKQADRAKMEYGADLNSDHLLYAKACSEYYRRKNNRDRSFRQWLDDFFLSDKTLDMLMQMHDDLRRYLSQLDLLEKSNRRPYTSELLAVVAASLHIAVKFPGAKKFACAQDIKCSIHPSSLLKNLGELVKGGKRGRRSVEGQHIHLVAWFSRLKTSDVYLHDTSNVEDVIPLLLLGSKISIRTKKSLDVHGILPIAFENQVERDAIWNLRTELQKLVNLQVGRKRSAESVRAFDALASLFELTAAQACTDAIEMDEKSHAEPGSEPSIKKSHAGGREIAASTGGREATASSSRGGSHRKIIDLDTPDDDEDEDDEDEDEEDNWDGRGKKGGKKAKVWKRW